MREELWIEGIETYYWEEEEVESGNSRGKVVLDLFQTEIRNRSFLEETRCNKVNLC